MKKIIITAAVSAAAVVGFAGTTSAAPAETNDKACFGQIHKFVNAGGLATVGIPALENIENVGQLVQASDGKGQGKNAAAKSFC